VGSDETAQATQKQNMNQNQNQNQNQVKGQELICEAKVTAGRK